MTTNTESTETTHRTTPPPLGGPDAPPAQHDESEPAWKPPDQTPGIGFWLLMVLSLGFVGGLAFLQYRHVDAARKGGADRQQARTLPIIAELPDFTLIERSGRRVGLSDLRGRVWIADFVFTYCAGPCPVMTARMAELQELLKRERFDDVICVTFTVDPERDTPERLTEYADAFGAETGRWLFLTGDKKPIRDLAIKGFHITVEDPEQGDDQILHSTRFVLVDHLGRIRGYYSMLTDEEEYDIQVAGSASGIPDTVKRDLLKDIRTLRREAGR